MLLDSFAAPRFLRFTAATLNMQVGAFRTRRTPTRMKREIQQRRWDKYTVFMCSVKARSEHLYDVMRSAMMPFLRTPPANDINDTESITTSIEDRAAEEYRVWAAYQEFMENCIQLDGVIFDARSELSLEDQYTIGQRRRAKSPSKSGW